MDNETLFYIAGITLAVLAVAFSFLGLKLKEFPGRAGPAVAVLFAVLVGATTTFAVLHAKDEHAHDEGEIHEVQEESEAAHAQEAE